MVLFKEVCSDTISTFLKEMNIFCNLEGFDKEYTFVSHFELFDCMNEWVVFFLIWRLNLMW